jgi:peptidyl-prolyl cis-trans isomerase D
MAAIGSIRKHSTLLLIIVALALLAFLLGDLSGNNRGNKIYDKFITVGKQNISYNNFLDKSESTKNVIKRLNGIQQFTPQDDFQLGIQAYDELVDSIVLAKQAAYLGITITADELRDLVAGPNPHQMAQQFFSGEGGAYNMQVAQQFLDNMDQYPDTAIIFYYMSYIEPTIEKDAFTSKYFSLLTGAYHLPKVFAEKMANESLLKSNIEVVQIPYSSPLASDDKISFTEEDLKKCYEKNKYRFKQDEELRSVEYVMFNIEPTEEDLRNIEEEVNTLFEEFKETDRPDYFVNRLVDSRYDSSFHKRGELGQGIDTLLFNAPVGTFAEPFIDGEYWKFAKLLATQIRPDSINFTLIAVAHNGMDQNNPRKKEESDKIADTAYMMARIGIDFYEVAKRYSDLDIEQWPDQGRMWAEDGKSDQLTQLFFDSLNMLPVGSIKRIDLPKYGATYIFRVNEKTAPQHKIRVAIARKQITPSRETVNNIENRANNFVNGTDDYQKFKEAAVKYTVDPRINDRVQKMDYTLPGIQSGGREIVRWIYGEETKKGMVSHVFTLEDMYVVAVVKDIYHKGYRTLEQEQVRNQIETIVKRDKKAELLENALKQSLSSGLSTIAANNNVIVDTITVSFADRNFGRYGPEGKVIGKLFATKEGSTDILKGDMGVYAVKINGFDTPSMDVSQSNQNNIDMIMMQNRMMNQNRFQNGARSMRKIYEIKDNMILVM